MRIDVIKCLQQEGWFLVGGVEVKKLAGLVEGTDAWRFATKLPRLPVTNVRTVHDSTKELGNDLLLEFTAGDQQLRVPFGNIGTTDACRIVFNGFYTHRQQKKREDGGGVHEVMLQKPALIFENPVAIQARDLLIEQQREAKRKRTKEADKAFAKKCEDERQARRSAFMAQLKAKCVGHTIMDIHAEQQSLFVILDDGSTIMIELDGGDTFDAWINVDGISLESFD